MIYPIWIHGEYWPQSAPFSLITYNYTDCRKFESELRLKVDAIINEIIDGLPRMFEGIGSGGLSQIVLCEIVLDNRSVYFIPEKFAHFFEILQEMYSSFLHEQVEPFSYGSEWCLKHCRDYYLLPASWALNQGVPVIHDGYMQKSPAELGIVPGQSYSVESIKPVAETNARLHPPSGLF